MTRTTFMDDRLLSVIAPVSGGDGLCLSRSHPPPGSATREALPRWLMDAGQMPALSSRRSLGALRSQAEPDNEGDGTPRTKLATGRIVAIRGAVIDVSF